MSTTGVQEFNAKYHRNAELFKALMNTEDEEKVIELCRSVPGHALRIISVHHDSVLHLAIYLNRRNLVFRLLEDFPEQLLDKMTRQNIAGNTVLHETALGNDSVEIANKLLRKAPGLLGMRNNNGETALFRAARTGNAKTFNFLAGKISAYDEASKEPFLQSADKTTVLHISIIAQHFDLALQIASNYKHLIGLQDPDGMTALQLLSCNPEAFKWNREDKIFKKFINFVKSICNSAWRERVRLEEQRYESAIKLAKFLIEIDTSWEFISPIRDKSRTRAHKYGNIEKKKEEEPGVRNEAETPLFIAAMSGCVEIVQEIFKTYPQAIGYIDGHGRNILHVAIMYRQLKIFELVAKEMKDFMLSLSRKVDNDGNTILHMVGIKIEGYIPEKMEGPALELQEELLLFERVKEVSASHFVYHQNNMGLTAEGLFAAANHELRMKSKEWLKHTAEGCSVVAVLIATVAFAAAYTIPGGPNQSTGFPVLINHPFFLIFTISDVLSLTFSLASVVTFLSILTSPFRLHDFKHSLPNKMSIGFSFLFLSVSMMMIAFGSTVLLMIKKKESWAKIMLYTCSFIPVGIFSLSYFPLFIRTSIYRAFTYLSKKTGQFIPECFLALLKKILDCFCYCTCRAPSASSFIP